MGKLECWKLEHWNGENGLIDLLIPRLKDFYRIPLYIRTHQCNAMERYICNTKNEKNHETRLFGVTLHTLLMLLLLDP